MINTDNTDLDCNRNCKISLISSWTFMIKYVTIY